MAHLPREALTLNAPIYREKRPTEIPTEGGLSHWREAGCGGTDLAESAPPGTGSSSAERMRARCRSEILNLRRRAAFVILPRASSLDVPVMSRYRRDPHLGQPCGYRIGARAWPHSAHFHLNAAILESSRPIEISALLR